MLRKSHPAGRDHSVVNSEERQVESRGSSKRQEARGKRQEARGKRQEARGKRQEARRSKRKEVRGTCWILMVFRGTDMLNRTIRNILLKLDGGCGVILNRRLYGNHRLVGRFFTAELKGRGLQSRIIHSRGWRNEWDCY